MQQRATFFEKRDNFFHLSQKRDKTRLIENFSFYFNTLKDKQTRVSHARQACTSDNSRRYRNKLAKPRHPIDASSNTPLRQTSPTAAKAQASRVEQKKTRETRVFTERIWLGD
ncbi:hypothetical protein [Rhabdochromatium marinum]|uniref:hypothetical protein n=1 Tax=Rhabdochromatium marinum TaxID=48729 RepID=UPI001908EFD2|nr:hypothetical protein [Rhabdochromatium marinum]